MTEYAFSTDNPAALAAWHDSRAARRVFTERITADTVALGGNKGALVRSGIWGSRDELVGLAPDGSGVIPDGWRIVRDRLEPRRGKAGAGAREWLAAHQPPDVRHALVEHGLPRHSTLSDRDSGSFRLSSPALFEHDGALWACYEGKPGDHVRSDGTECTWTPRKLSEFHAAREAVEAAQVDAEAVAR